MGNGEWEIQVTIVIATFPVIPRASSHHIAALSDRRIGRGERSNEKLGIIVAIGGRDACDSEVVQNAALVRSEKNGPFEALHCLVRVAEQECCDSRGVEGFGVAFVAVKGTRQACDLAYATNVVSRGFTNWSERPMRKAAQT